MRTLVLAVLSSAALLLLASPASAQGRRPTTPTPTPTPSIWSDSGSSSSASSAAAAVSAPAHREADEGYRPEGTSIGLGAGYQILGGAAGELLFNPNVVSARFRMASGLEIEPIAGLVLTNDNSKVDSAKTTSTAMDIFAGANIRKPFWSRNQAEVVFIVGAELEIGSTSAKDAADQKTTSSSFGLGANYGIGVEFWPRSHWSVGFDATNPVLSFSSSSGKDPAGVKTTTTHMSISPAWDPGIRLMTHLYY